MPELISFSAAWRSCIRASWSPGARDQTFWENCEASNWRAWPEIMGRKRKAASRKSRRHVQQWKDALEAELGALPGVWVEDKDLSLAVHYRQSANKAAARRRILAAAQDLKQARVYGGKQVVNIVMDDAPHKGDALAAERIRLGCDSVLYVGDDDNDEDAFALKGDVVPVRIGRKRNSQARYYLRTQEEIDQLLDLLCCMRLKTPVSARRSAFDHHQSEGSRCSRRDLASLRTKPARSSATRYFA